MTAKRKRLWKWEQTELTPAITVVGSASVRANTKSEARAEFKWLYGLKKRLPVGARIVEVRGGVK